VRDHEAVDGDDIVVRLRDADGDRRRLNAKALMPRSSAQRCVSKALILRSRPQVGVSKDEGLTPA